MPIPTSSQISMPSFRINPQATASSLKESQLGISNPLGVNRSFRSRNRYYLDEYFSVLPTLKHHLFGFVTKDFGSIADGNEEVQDITATGASVGDFAFASLEVDTVDLTLVATVARADLCTVVLSNNTGGAIDLASATLNVRVLPKLVGFGSVSNIHFEVAGTNMTSALVTRPTTHAGITLTTAGADRDQAIIVPHLVNNSGWVTPWGTENRVEWECSIRTGTIGNIKIWAGLKLTNGQLIATNADQAYFKFQTDATNSETFTDFTKLHFVHSIGGVDRVSQLPITVAADTTYHLKIVFDLSRKPHIFVNGIKYKVTNATTAGGVVVTSGQESDAEYIARAAMTDNIDLIPYIGVEAGSRDAAVLHIHYESINRVMFE